MQILVKQIRQRFEKENAVFLFNKYQEELDVDITFQNFNEEINDPIKKYNKNYGGLFMAYCEGDLAGCVALQNLGKNICEMKRLYVLPEYRRYGVGKVLVEALLKYAAILGYKTMKLDTLEKLQPAIILYKKLGFVPTTPYYNNPLPNVVYLEKKLGLTFLH